MIYWDQITIIFILINIIVVIWIVSGYYFYKNYYIPKLEQQEPDFAEGLNELFENLTDSISESIKGVKLDFNLDEISNKLTEQFFGTFLAILGVSEEYNEDWSFKTYISEVIDSSVQKIVPQTVTEFEKILPEFAESFIEGIQKALTGVVDNIPEGGSVTSKIQQAMPEMPELDIGKMIQMYLLQYMTKQMAGGGLGSLMSNLGGTVNPGSPGQSSF